MQIIVLILNYVYTDMQLYCMTILYINDICINKLYYKILWQHNKKHKFWCFW